MKRNRKRNLWPALWLVVLAAAVLSGCPHNNLIDGGGAGGVAGGGRGGGGDVRLIVTNFASNNGAGKSGSWLAPSRTISPDHIDLKNDKDNYVFVAEGESNQGEAYGPEYITLENDGSTSLGIAGGGIWSVTVRAYDVTKLQGVGNGVTGTTNTGIMQQTPDSQTIIDHGDDALVLQGKATLDLGMNSTGSVTVTLTNDGVGTEGNVLVTVNFDTGDESELNAKPNGYSVTVGLYDFTTGDLVGLEDEIKPNGQTLTNPDVTSITNVPKGRYQFRVTVEETAGNTAVAYWTDEIYVEGNRDTTQEVYVSKLFDTPEKPTKAGVYWSRKDSGETRDGFLGYLSWEDIPFNAVGVDVQIADITTWYSSTNGIDDKANLQGTGAQDITTAEDLWTKIDVLPKAGAGAGTQPTFEQVVTELKWSDVPQKAISYPAIYKKGSLLNGSDGVVFLMETGHIYTVRIRAAGATASSDWLPINQTSTDNMGTKPKMIDKVPPALGGGQEAIKFNDGKLQKGIFDLVMLKYDLEGKYELAKTLDGQTRGTKAAESDLVVFKPYGEAITIELKYNNMTSPQQNDWFLYPLGSTDIDQRSMGWKGWKGVQDPTKEFNATVGTPGDWSSYSGHTDLTLVPVGAGAGASVQAATSGTFNVLTENTVLVTLEADDNAAATAGFLELVNGDTNPNGDGGADVKNAELGIQKDPTGNRYILNMDDAAKNKRGGNATWLYVSVGDDPAAPGTLTDKNGTEFTVQDIEVRILQRGLVTVKTFRKASSSMAYEQLDGMASGTYELEVRVLSSTGYWETFKTPLAIKYNNQTIP